MAGLRLGFAGLGDMGGAIATRLLDAWVGRKVQRRAAIFRARVNLGTDADPFRYFVVGAFNNINNIDTKDRTLVIYGSKDAQLRVRLVNLADASTAPEGADLETVVIDKNTGMLYIQ